MSAFGGCLPPSIFPTLVCEIPGMSPRRRWEAPLSARQHLKRSPARLSPSPFIEPAPSRFPSGFHKVSIPWKVATRLVSLTNYMRTVSPALSRFPGKFQLWKLETGHVSPAACDRARAALRHSGQMLHPCPSAWPCHKPRFLIRVQSLAPSFRNPAGRTGLRDRHDRRAGRTGKRIPILKISSPLRQNRLHPGDPTNSGVTVNTAIFTSSTVSRIRIAPASSP